MPELRQEYLDILEKREWSVSGYTDDRKGMLSTPGRGPSVYETAAVYSEIFRRARAARAVAPLAVYSAAKYDETMTAARKRASVMLGL